MIIFITIPWFAPAYRAGGPIQSIVNLVNTYQEGVEYRIFTSNTDLNDTPLHEIKTGRWVFYNAHTQVWYSTRVNRSNILVKEISKIKPDVLYINGIYSWHFNLVPLLFSRAKRKIISVRGMLHPGALAQKSMKKKAYLRLWKMFNWQRKAVFHASDEIEAGYILQYLKKVPVFTAFNFPRPPGPVTVAEKKEGKLKLLSIGLISPMKNYLQVLEVLKVAKERIVYSIYGPVKDNKYWQQCLLAIEDMPPNVTVLYMGELKPFEVSDALAEAEVFILPSKSENFGHAIFEALGAGKPVITSHATPWKNLKEKKAGMNVEVNKNELKEAISFFAALGEEEYNIWSHGALTYAAGAIDTEHLMKQYDELFRPAVAQA